ncbi:TIGR03086 family metal-binding protein [Mycobacterium spongiae]|uniref:TIGR03086 family metal-binding protein n=1 Tax=Mycobacterium spongiae TaxID=886343 RepID=UPI001FE6D7DE|nr:TIGR03086 family metal-binding protein [Mycobacterium spongiae]
MVPESQPGPDAAPTDELASAEATLVVLQQALHTVAADDLSRPTPCSEYDVSQLTGHLLNSVMVIGRMVDADFSDFSVRDQTASVERQIMAAARPALDAWHRHGLHGEVPLAHGSMPARVAASVLSIEFLVHAWDYAVALGHDITAPDSLTDYVLGLAQQLIKPEERVHAGFDDPVDVSEDASALDRLVAFTGRNPAT